jgi:hypothetical protein
VRVLNRSGYTFLGPAIATLVLWETIGLTSLNADSLEDGTGAGVWRIGDLKRVPVGDSTAVKTLIVRINDSTNVATLSLEFDPRYFHAMGWEILTSQGARIDTTRRVQRPGTSLVYYRTSLSIGFKDATTDASKQAFFSRNGLTVLGVTTSQQFFVSFADPGPGIDRYDALVAKLRADPSIRFVVDVCHSGCIITVP